MSYYIKQKDFPTWHNKYVANSNTYEDITPHLATSASTANSSNPNYQKNNSNQNFLERPLESRYAFMKSTDKYQSEGKNLVWKGTGSYAEQHFTNSKLFSFGYGFSLISDSWLSEILETGYMSLQIIHNGSKIYAKTTWSTGFSTEVDIITSNPPKCLFFELTGGGGGSAGCVSRTGGDENCWAGGGGGGGAGIYGILDFTQSNSFAVQLGRGGQGGSSGTYGNNTYSAGEDGQESWIKAETSTDGMNPNKACVGGGGGAGKALGRR